MNNTILPPMMTKSYLFESDPYLKTPGTKGSSFVAATAAVDDHLYCNPPWNMTLGSGGNDERRIVKPLTLHNLPSNAPPIAYVNGNSVRAIRSRHYSQQQTVIHHNNNNSHGSSKPANNNTANVDSGIGSHNKRQFVNDKSSNTESCNKADGDTDHYATVKENGLDITDKNGYRFSSMAPKSLKVTGQPSSGSSSSSSGKEGAAVAGAQQEKQPSLRDYVTNSDYESSTNYNDNIKQVIEHLAKQIEGVLRLAKESRRLICSELLVPHMLTAHIAQEVIELAESEPCGLRGCLLFICIEDNQHSKLKSAGANSHSSNSQAANATKNQLTPAISSRLLGEFAIDPSVVPTFEVFLTLKRAAPNWFESIEHIILGKERIVLSEVYLLHKKKLYQPSSPTL